VRNYACSRDRRQEQDGHSCCDLEADFVAHAASLRAAGETTVRRRSMFLDWIRSSPQD
jgi:hypothetical protein